MKKGNGFLPRWAPVGESFGTGWSFHATQPTLTMTSIRKVFSMTTMRLLIFCLLVLASISRSEAAQNPVMLYWDELVQPDDFKKALDAFCGGPKHDWPAVFSVKHSSSLEEPAVAEQRKLWELSETLLRGLETYEAMMRTNALPNFVVQSAALLAMRGQLDRNPSYANLVLIDGMPSRAHYKRMRSVRSDAVRR